MRLNVVYANLSKWKNPTFSAAERKERDEYMRMLVSEAEKFDEDKKDLHASAPSSKNAVLPLRPEAPKAEPTGGGASGGVPGAVESDPA